MYLLEQKYWRKFPSLPLDDSEKVFPQKSTLGDFKNASPDANLASGKV